MKKNPRQLRSLDLPTHLPFALAEKNRGWEYRKYLNTLQTYWTDEQGEQV